MAGSEPTTSEPIPFDDPAGLIEVAFRLFVNPELHARAARGEMELPFGLEAAQVLFDPTGNAEVRLNDEVNGALGIEDPVDRKAGETLMASAVKAFTSFERDDDDSDRAHITLVYREHEGEKLWTLFADPRVNLPAARISYESGVEFLETARLALRDGYSRAVVENLFLAMELLVKAELLTLPVEKHLSKSGRNHGYWLRTHRKFGGALPARDAGVRSHQWLIDNHLKARYREFEVDEGKLREALEEVESMVSIAKRQIRNTQIVLAEFSVP